MKCIRHATGQAFLDRAMRWLLQRESENNLIIGIAEQLAVNPLPNSFLATMEDGDEVVGCAFRTPPYKLGVTSMPDEAAALLGNVIADEYDDAPAVLGPDTTASIVAAVIADRKGKQVSQGMMQRIYELHHVDFPENPPAGRLRLAQQSDAELVTRWLDDFAKETNHGPGDMRNYAASHITNKTMFFWDVGGEVRTVALWAGRTPNGVRIGFVYTPAEHRGKGYASACVAGASQRALDSGCSFCCLYTDLSNGTSNRIYQNIGYRPVADVMDFNLVD